MDFFRIFATDVGPLSRASPNIEDDILRALRVRGMDVTLLRVKQDKTWITQLDLIVDGKVIRCMEEKDRKGEWRIGRADDTIRGVMHGVSIMDIMMVPTVIRDCSSGTVYDLIDVIKAHMVQHGSNWKTWWPVTGEQYGATLSRLTRMSPTVDPEIVDWRYFFSINAGALADTIKTVALF